MELDPSKFETCYNSVKGEDEVMDQIDSPVKSSVTMHEFFE